MIVDGRRINSCLTLAVMHEGSNVTTVEGLGQPTNLHPLQAAFVKHDGFQCGYCTPGFVMAAKGYLDRHNPKSEQDVEKGLGGNLCRCGTYVGVRKAVLEAAREMKGGRNA